MEELYFKNYLDLCRHFGLEPKGGKSRACQINKLAKDYNIRKEGNKYIFTKKDLRSLKDDKIARILKSTERNSFYLKNNAIIYLYKLNLTKDNIYAVYSIQQMRDFGFLRKDIKPIYAYNTFIFQNPTYHLSKKFENKLADILSCSSSKKEVMDVVGEVYRILYNRYSKLMNSTLYSLVSANKYFDISSIYSQGEWLKFKSCFKHSLNIMSKEIKLIGIPLRGEEFVLQDKELFNYLDIRNQVFEESGFTSESYEAGLKKRGTIYSRIQERCKEELGIQVVYKKIYYGLISNLDKFNITFEQYEEARKSNNSRMRDTLINYYSKKCGDDEALKQAYIETILYITDIED